MKFLLRRQCRKLILDKLLFFGLMFCLIAIDIKGASAKDIEIISAGKRYESLRIYKQSESMKNLANQMAAEKLMEQKGIVPLSIFKRRDRLSQFPWESVLRGVMDLNMQNIQTVLNVSLKAGIRQEKRESKRDAEFIYNQYLPSFIAMRKVGYNTVIANIIEDFYQANGKTVYYKQLKPQDLEEALSRSIEDGDYTGPILLISDKKKLRIMTLDSSQTE